MNVSVVICSVDAGKMAAMEAHYRAAMGSDLTQLIKIGDARLLAEGYNRGIDQATGEIIILSHDDVEFVATDWWGRMKGHLEHCDLLGVAGASYYAGGPWGQVGPPYLAGQVANPLSSFGSDEPGFWVSIYGVEGPRMNGMKVMDGLFLAAHRRVVEKVRFDAGQFDGFHGYDLDFTYSASRAGFRLSVATDVAPIHSSSGSFDDTFLMYVEKVNGKHRASFGPVVAPQCRFAGVRVNTREEMLRVMLPGEYPLSAVKVNSGLNILGVGKI